MDHKKVLLWAVNFGLVLLLVSACGAPQPAAPPQPTAMPELPTMTPEPSPVYIPTGSVALKSLVSGGADRKYSLYVPSTYDPTQSYPMVFLLHPYKSSGAVLDAGIGASKLAEEVGFILALPQGVDAWWKDGDPNWPADEITLADEVTFFSDLIDEVSAQYNVDPLRIYVTGASNGGCMTYSLACRLGNRIAAIGPVVGDLMLNDCEPGRPLPVIHIHGILDPMFKGTRPTTGSPTDVRATMVEWAARNGCSDETEVVYQQGKVTCTAYKNCDKNASVELCIVQGIGHDWPGPLLTGFDATRALWEFFAAHPMPEQ